MGVRGKENFFLKSFPSPENLHLRQPPVNMHLLFLNKNTNLILWEIDKIPYTAAKTK